MKKAIFIFGIMLFYLILGNVSENSNLIPKEAIRIRVLANSNSRADQEEKMKVKGKVENYLYNKLAYVNDINSANTIIENNILELENVIENVYEGNFTINYGMNYFPEKEYKGIIYDEGYYNSLVISLGKGLGENWWCVLFPPLCMLEGNEMDDVEYRSLVGDLVNQYLK